MSSRFVRALLAGALLVSAAVASAAGA